MLLAQKAYCEGALALALYCARLVDEQHTGSAKDADVSRLLLEVLTPIVKSFPSQWCLEANSLAIQIHGGYGYTRDFPVEQYWRDNRLNMIHEGTHGIQAMDLLGRKVLDGKRAWPATSRLSVCQATADKAQADWPRRSQQRCDKLCIRWVKRHKRHGQGHRLRKPWPMPCLICRLLATPWWLGFGSMWSAPWAQTTQQQPMADVPHVATFTAMSCRSFKLGWPW